MAGPRYRIGQRLMLSSLCSERAWAYQPSRRLTVGNTIVTPLSISANQILALPPALPDGVRDVSVIDPATGSSTMAAALTLGAGANDVIHLAQGGNSPTPVGMAAATPIRVVVASSDGITPVPVATVQWSVTNGAAFPHATGPLPAMRTPTKTDKRKLA